MDKDTTIMKDCLARECGDPLGYRVALNNFLAERCHSESHANLIYSDGIRVLNEMLTFTDGESAAALYNPSSWESCDGAGRYLTDALSVFSDAYWHKLILGKPYCERHRSHIPNIVAIHPEIPFVCKIGNFDSLQDTHTALTLLDKPELQDVGIHVAGRELHRLRDTRMGMLITDKAEGVPANLSDWRNPTWLYSLVQNEIAVWYQSYSAQFPAGANGNGISPVDYTSAGNAIVSVDNTVTIIDADMRTVSGKSKDPRRGVSGQLASILNDELKRIGVSPAEIGMKYVPGEKKLEWHLQ